MDFKELKKFFIDIYQWCIDNIVVVSVVSGIIVLVGLGIGIYFIYEKNYEDSLKMKFDKSYLQYLSGSKDSAKQSESFKNFFDTLQEIASVNKNYDIVAIANIMLGDIYYNEGNSYNLSLNYYSKATNAPSVFLRVTAIFDVAQAYESLDNSDAALSNYEYIYKNYPDSYLAPVSMLGASKIYSYKGDQKSARAVLNELSNKYPNSSANYFVDLFGLVLTNHE